MNMSLKGMLKSLNAKPGQVVSNPFARAFAPQINEKVDMDTLRGELNHLKKKYPGKKIEYGFIQNSKL